MSKYTTYNISTFRSEECLLATLADLGWDSGKVEVHDKPQTLLDWHGKARPEKANIIIRRGKTGVSASNDIGFLLQEDGTYKPIISDYDSTAVGGGYGRYGADLFTTLTERYSSIAGDKAIETILTKTLPRMKMQGLVPRHATAKVQTTGKTRQIVVAY
jgi:hypothetical protein